MRARRCPAILVGIAVLLLARAAAGQSIETDFYVSPARLPGQMMVFSAGTQGDVMPAPRPIAVDGDLHEWNRRQRFGSFTRTTTGARPKLRGEIYGAYDDQALFLAIVCADTEANVKSLGPVKPQPGHDRGDVHQADCVQIHLDADEDPAQFFTVAINARGDWDDARVADPGATRWLPPCRSDRPGHNPVGEFFGAQGYGRGPRNTDLAWNPTIVTQAGRRPAAWTVEMRIPWRDLGVQDLKRFMRLRFNVVRFKKSQPAQVSSWAACSYRYFVPASKEIHYASKYGCLRLRPAPFALYRAEMPRPLYGRNVLRVTLKGTKTKKAWPLSFRLTELRGGRDRTLASLSAEWPPAERETSFTLPFDLRHDPAAERFRLHLRIETAGPDGHPILVDDLAKEFHITPPPLHFFILKGRYYDTETMARGIAKVNAADDLWRAGALRLELTDAEGEVIATERIRPLRERGVAIRLALAELRLGKYVARATLLDAAGRAIATSSSGFEKVTAADLMRPVTRQTVPLRIDDPQGVRVRNVPLYCGVPIPEGQLRDEAHVRLMDDRGRDVPCQVEVLKRWCPGESIQWLGVHFSGELGAGRNYRMQYGRQVRRSPATGITWRETQDALTVDTGKIKAVLRRGSPRLLDEVCLDTNADGRFAPEEQMIGHGPQGLSLTDDTGVVYRFRPEDGQRGLEVELAGPLHLIVRREGDYVSERGETCARQILRLHFYAGRPEVKVMHTWIFTADSDKVRLADLALGLRLRTKGAMRAVFNIAPEPNRTASYGLKPGVALAMRQDWHPHHGDTRSVFGVHERRGDKERSLMRATVGGNWARLESAAGCATLILKDFAYMFPKELEIGEGVMEAHLWSSRGGLIMDMSTKGMMKYWGGNFAEPNRKALSRLPSQAYGIARTHELLLRFDQPGASSESSAALAARTQRPPYVVPEPEWTCAAGVFGRIHPVDDARFPEAEYFLRDRMDRILGILALWDFGFFDYGAGPHNAYRFDEDGRFHAGVYRYTNHEYGTDKYLWLHLWRSAERRYFEHADRHSLYQMDLVTCHATDEELGRHAGLYNRDSPIPWSGKHSLTHATHFAHRIEVAMYHHYFTGCRRALDVMREYAAAKKRMYGYARSAPFGGSFDGMSRAAFANLRELQALYEFTRDPQILEILHGLAGHLILPETEAGINLDKRQYPPGVGHEKYKVVPLKHYYDLTRREDVKRSFVKLARWVYRTYNRGGVYGVTYARGAWGYMFANAYRFTRDPRYAGFLRAGLDAMTRNVGHFATDRLPERNWKRAGYMLSAPYAMAVLAELKEPPPAFPFEIIAGTLPNTVYVDKGDKPVNLEIYCAKMDGLALAGPDGKRMEKPLGPKPRPQYITLRLPADARQGVYRLSHPGRDRFIIVRTDARRLVVGAPRGMMMDALEGCPPHYFQVPTGTKRFTVRTSLPAFVRVKDGAGHDVRPAASERGVLRFDVPAGGDGRTWSVDVGRFSRTRDYGKTIFVALEGVPAVLAPQSPAHFFLPPGLKAPGSFGGTDYKKQDRFVAGRSNRKGDRALSLADGAVFAVHRGKPLGPLTFEHFDSRQGTIEMFIRFLKTPAEFDAFWAMNICNDSSSFDHFGIRYGHPKRTFWVEFRGVSGRQTRWHHSALPQVFLLDGQWHHVALTWHNDGSHLQAELYVDGLRLTYEDRLPLLQPMAIGEEFVVGGARPRMEAFCGEIDDLRISDVVRYHPRPGPRLGRRRPLTLQPSFTPPGDRDIISDRHTLALCRFDRLRAGRFDGTFGGICGKTGEKLNGELRRP